MLEKIDRARDYIWSLDALPFEKLYALLTYDGLKPATLMRTDETRNITADFRELGIEARVTSYKLDHKLIFIGYSQATLDGIDDSFSKLMHLIQIDSKLKDEIWQEEYKKISYDIGMWLGYPVTSVLFYINEYNQALIEGNMEVVKAVRDRSDAEEKPLSFFMPFVTSPKYHYIERETSVIWQEHIKKNYPLEYFQALVEWVR